MALKIEGKLKVPLGPVNFCEIPLNDHVKQLMLDCSVKLKSLLLTPNSLSICYPKEVPEIEYYDVVGVDRNLQNLTVGNNKQVCQYDLSKAIDVVENTLSTMREEDNPSGQNDKAAVVWPM